MQLDMKAKILVRIFLNCVENLKKCVNDLNYTQIRVDNKFVARFWMIIFTDNLRCERTFRFLHTTRHPAQSTQQHIYTTSPLSEFATRGSDKHMNAAACQQPKYCWNNHMPQHTNWFVGNVLFSWSAGTVETIIFTLFDLLSSASDWLLEAQFKVDPGGPLDGNPIEFDLDAC